MLIRDHRDHTRARFGGADRHTYVKEPGQYIQYAEARTGYRVTSYTEYYEDGELVDKEVLAETYYPPIRGIILCYPGYENMTGEEVVTPLPH
jgi:hypothetical protein